MRLQWLSKRAVCPFTMQFSQFSPACSDTLLPQRVALASCTIPLLHACSSSLPQCPNCCVCVCREIREMAVRGVDGPGLHILDVLPDAWDHVEGEWDFPSC